MLIRPMLTCNAQHASCHVLQATYSCEDDADVANKLLCQRIPLLLASPLHVQPDAPSHQCVLAHKDNTVLTQTLQVQ